MFSFSCFHFQLPQVQLCMHLDFFQYKLWMPFINGSCMIPWAESSRPPSWHILLALQQERPEVLVSFSILVIIWTKISVPTCGSFRPHTPSSTATAGTNKIKAALLVCVSSCGLDLALIFHQCWQTWRLCSARYFIWSISHRKCLLVHLWWHLGGNPWPYVVFEMVPLRKGYRNKAWHTSPLVLDFEDLWGTQFLHPINHKICWVYHTFVEEKFMSLFDEELRG